MIPEHFLKKPITTSQDLSAAVLNYTTSVGRNFGLEEVTVQSSVAITETITISRDSLQGATYDVILARDSLASESSFVFRPSGQCNFIKGDELKVQCTNANTTGIVYCEIKLREM